MKRARINIPDFEEAIILFSRFRHQQMVKKGPHRSEIAEADKRLEQLAWLTARVARVQAEEDRLQRREPSPPGTGRSHARWAKQMRSKGREVEILCESFYYFAFRFGKILNLLDGFRGFYKILNINAIRNDLIEHPTILNPNFTWGIDLPKGPRIKEFGDRKDGKPRVFDKGLYVNAQQLIDELIPRLRRQLPSTQEPG